MIKFNENNDRFEEQMNATECILKTYDISRRQTELNLE